MGDVFDPTVGALNTALNLRLLNQNVISANIANADTPGYKAKRVDFEGELRRALGGADGIAPLAEEPGHLGPKSTDPVHPQVVEDNNGVQSLDGNSVDRNQEMALMSENQILYNANIEMLKKKLGMMKYAVTDGGGGR